MSDARLPLARALAYAAPGFALAIPLVPVFTFLPTLYARDLGLGLARTGTVLFVARAADFLLDPLIGLGSDRIETRLRTKETVDRAGRDCRRRGARRLVRAARGRERVIPLAVAGDSLSRLHRGAGSLYRVGRRTGVRL